MIRQHHSSFHGLTFGVSLFSALAALAPLGCGSNETAVVKPNNGSQGGSSSTSTTATTAVGGSSSSSSSSTSSSVGGTAAGGTKADTGGTKANTGGTNASTTTSSTEAATGGEQNAGGTTSEDTNAGSTENAGGTDGAGGSQNAGGTDGAGGSAATGGTKATSTAVCADGTPFKLSTDTPQMTDFTEVKPTTYDDTAAAATTPKWGGKGLTGGTFFYHQDATDGIKFSVVDETNSSVTSGKVAELKATMLAGHYAGFGFYFGPDCGTNACDYAGFSFKITGDLGGAVVDVQMQMTPDYPLNTDNKGKCDYGGVEADKWSKCTNPHAALADLLMSEFPLVIYEEVKVPWSSLIDGKPTGPIDCGQLLGIQVQLNCPEDADCTPDIKIADLKFYK